MAGVRRHLVLGLVKFGKSKARTKFEQLLGARKDFPILMSKKPEQSEKYVSALGIPSKMGIENRNKHGRVSVKVKVKIKIKISKTKGGNWY